MSLDRVRFRLVGLIVTLALGIVVAPLAADAQQAGKVYRIGYLSFGPPTDLFYQGLRDVGYVDVVDPVGAGLVQSLGRPGGNVTGLSMLSVELGGKRLELLKEVIPRVSRVAVLWNPANRSNVLQLEATEVAARALGVRLQPLEIRGPQDVESAIQAATRQRAGALITLDDPFLFLQRARIVALTAKNRLPAMYGLTGFVEAGGLMSYGANLADHYRQAATYVDISKCVGRVKSWVLRV